jgi:hypothetical protein
MLVSIGDISAHCPHCKGTDFEQTSAGLLQLTTELKCRGCGVRQKYLALLDQIGEEAMRRAEGAIDALKKHPSRPTRKG